MQCSFVGYVINEAINCQIVIGLWEQSSMSLNPNFLPSRSLHTLLWLSDC